MTLDDPKILRKRTNVYYKCKFGNRYMCYAQMRCLMKHVHFGNVTLTNKAVTDHELRVHFQAAVYAYRRRQINEKIKKKKTRRTLR